MLEQEEVNLFLAFQYISSARAKLVLSKENSIYSGPRDCFVPRRYPSRNTLAARDWKEYPASVNQGVTSRGRSFIPIWTTCN